MSKATSLELSKIRNVVILSHGGAGKTSLCEAMLHAAGATERLGKVSEGNTVSDFDPEEIKRKTSINAALAPLEWLGDKYNLLDTPGYFDFVGEQLQGVRVADAAIIVVSGKSGVSVGTEKAWTLAAERKIPRIVFVNKMDEDNADYYRTVDQLREAFGKTVAPFQVPIWENDHFVGMVNTVELTAGKLVGSQVVEIDIPEEYREKVLEIRNMLIESVAETSEELMERFFAGDEFTVDEIHHALRIGVENGDIVPVLCGSSFTTVGVRALLNAIYEYFPAPDEMGNVVGQNPKTGDMVERKLSLEEPFSALVFKTVADPYVGKLSYFKVFSGEITPDSTVYNSVTDTHEKIGHLYMVKGKKQIEVQSIGAGDIGAVTKLQKTGTGDTLCDVAKPIVISGIEFPKPVISMAIVPKAKGDEEKISTGLHRLVDEDPTIHVEQNHETHQMLLSGMGDQHLEIIVSKLKSKFGVSVDLIVPKVPYREKIRKKVKVEGKHKKQSGGHGQYGHVWIEFEPGEMEGLTFEEKVFGGAVPRNFFPAVEKGLQESLVHGVLAGYPVVQLKATLVDGSYHPVDSSEMAFKIAAHLAFKKGLETANPVLLEPISHIEVVVPESYMGDVIGDMNKRRGRILGMNPLENGLQQVVAEVPTAEIFKYATDLRSMTQGRGVFHAYFVRYEDAPEHIAQKVIAESKAEREE